MRFIASAYDQVFPDYAWHGRAPKNTAFLPSTQHDLYQAFIFIKSLSMLRKKDSKMIRTKDLSFKLISMSFFKEIEAVVIMLPWINVQCVICDDAALFMSLMTKIIYLDTISRHTRHKLRLNFQRLDLTKFL